MCEVGEVTFLIVHSVDGLDEERCVGLSVFHKNQQQLQRGFNNQPELQTHTTKHYYLHIATNKQIQIQNYILFFSELN